MHLAIPCLQTLKELGDFRVLSAAGWHAIHRRFETRLGPAPDGVRAFEVETLWKELSSVASSSRFRL